MLRSRSVLPLVPCLLALAAPLGAAPADPVTITRPPEDQGAAFAPGLRFLEDLPAPYVEEEFFASGMATLYSYANDPPAGPTDIVPIQEDVPYQTRLMVRRPAKSEHFNGTVVVEWWNSSATFDSAPVWDMSAEYFARQGFIYVGVTNANQALAFLVGGCSLFGLLPPTCGTRYATLSLPDDGLAYEMMSQISNLLRSDAPENPIPSGYRVERLYHTGQSQQGGSVITYASAFHMPGVTDGYFVHANVFARPINGGPTCGDLGVPPYPGCTPELQGDDVYVRSDLPVPLAQALGETDVEALFGIGGRQPDAPNYRYYEMAGVAHLTVHEDIEVVPAGVLGPDPLLLEDLCENQINSSADGPVFGSYLANAMWQNLEKQVRYGTQPPPGRVLDVVAGAIQRDAYDNALGGVRLPALDVPTATYHPPTNQADPTLPPLLQFIGNLACFLSGSVTPFDAATLHDLYPDHGAYVSSVVHAANRLRAERFLLNADRKQIIERAARSGIGR